MIRSSSYTPTSSLILPLHSTSYPRTTLSYLAYACTIRTYDIPLTIFFFLYSFILLIISILLTDRDSFTARTRANDRLCRARRTVSFFPINIYFRFILLLFSSSSSFPSSSSSSLSSPATLSVSPIPPPPRESVSPILNLPATFSLYTLFLSTKRLITR